MSRKQRGIALLMVLLMLALLGSVIGDFQYNSRVDLQLALNARDGLQAEYNAMSALRLRALLLKNQSKYSTIINAVCQQFGVPNCPLGKILEMVPVECGIMSAVIKASESSSIDVEDVLEENEDAEARDIFPGDCIATSKSEHGKIPLRGLLAGNGQSGGVQTMMVQLLSDPRLERHFQEDDRNGTHAESPQELVGAITDWMDRDDTQSGNGLADEERPYDMLRDSYKPRNAPFDSLAELQLVHGVDDEMYAMLKDRVSIYTDGTQVDPAALDPFWLAFMTISMGLNPAAPPEPNLFIQSIAMLYVQIQELSAASGGMMTPNSSMLISMAQQTPIGSYLDTGALKRSFTDKPQSVWYTIESQGRVGNASIHITAVFQAREGQFWYVRIE